MSTLKETVDTSVWNSVGDSVYIFCLDSAGSSMKTRVWEYVKGSVMISVWGSVQESVSKSVQESVGNCVFSLEMRNKNEDS